MHDSLYSNPGSLPDFRGADFTFLLFQASMDTHMLKCHNRDQMLCAPSLLPGEDTGLENMKKADEPQLSGAKVKHNLLDFINYLFPWAQSFHNENSGESSRKEAWYSNKMNRDLQRTFTIKMKNRKPVPQNIELEMSFLPWRSFVQGSLGFTTQIAVGRIKQQSSLHVGYGPHYLLVQWSPAWKATSF